MNTYETLKAAKDLIKDPAKWVQGQFEKTQEDGTVCYCALGAISKVMGVSNSPNTLAATLLREVELSAVRKLGSREVWSSFAVFNDNHTHTEVMEAFDKAIVLAKQLGI
jgi:hypothetical protein